MKFQRNFKKQKKMKYAKDKIYLKHLYAINAKEFQDQIYQNVRIVMQYFVKNVQIKLKIVEIVIKYLYNLNLKLYLNKLIRLANVQVVNKLWLPNL